jgi:hypothetical protein
MRFKLRYNFIVAAALPQKAVSVKRFSVCAALARVAASYGVF